MNHITENIVYLRSSYGHFTVTDLLNCVSVTTTYPVAVVDPEDPAQGQRLLNHCQSEFDKQLGIQRYALLRGQRHVLFF